MAIDSIEYRAMSDIATIIQGLNLAGDGSATVPDLLSNVLVQSMPDTVQGNVQFPVCLVTGEDEAEEEGPRSNFKAAHVIYSIKVGIFDVYSQRPRDAMQVYLSWRNSMMQALREKVVVPILTNTTEVFDLRLKPGVVFKKKVKDDCELVTGFTVKCHAMQTFVKD